MSLTARVKNMTDNTAGTGNNLFPVFLKLEHLRLLIVGGGNIALEKLTAVLANSPYTSIRIVAPSIDPEIYALAKGVNTIVIIERLYSIEVLEDTDLVIVATNDKLVSSYIREDAKIKGILVNVADTPDLCDFYLGSIVKKGDLKIAISTNGKSPTMAKRLKETLNDALPNNFDEVLHNMNALRNRLQGDFTEKVARLNDITRELAVHPNIITNKKAEKKWRKIATWSIFAFFFLFIGNLVGTYYTIHDVGNGLLYIAGHTDRQFYLLILAGFLAQIVDGALGMGYGVTSTSVLLAIGVPLPAISGSIHTAEMFSSGASGFSHYKFGNVNKKLFKVIIVPGILGAIAGAYLLSEYGEAYAQYVKPLLACYTLFLGVKIILNAFKKKLRNGKLKNVGWLAGAGGFLDSFGGGGWGPLVTSTLISKGKTPRYVIGTVSITEFFVTLASAVTFFSFIGISHWQVILGLIIGGVLGAPIAARLAGRLPLKTMFIAVGSMIVFWSMHILSRVLL